jgi:2-polyprenyl-6-methoxyphenol hydroxylase-like FAD-dependent oxidoreductase
MIVFPAVSSGRRNQIESSGFFVYLPDGKAVLLKILIVGAGPAGLSFGALMSAADSSHSITILERAPAELLPGWGITLRNHALPFLGLNEKIATQSLSGRAFRRAGKLLIDLPYPPDSHLVTYPRGGLTGALADVCRSQGLSVTYEVDAQSLADDELATYDLVVAADGAHSPLRRRYDAAFKPTTIEGKNRFAWLGCDLPFDQLTILLSGGHPALLAWAYKYTAYRSTFIVECTERTYQELELAQKSAAETCGLIESSFETVLEGRPVLSETSISWLHYPVISCERLIYRNMALLGDAGHTTHFSQGFGTMFAFDDALSLAAALEGAANVADALERYEGTQQEKIEEFQSTAGQSMEWSEHLLESVEDDDEAVTQELIEARWPNNQFTTSPLDRELKA